MTHPASVSSVCRSELAHPGCPPGRARTPTSRWVPPGWACKPALLTLLPSLLAWSCATTRDAAPCAQELPTSAPAVRCSGEPAVVVETPRTRTGVPLDVTLTGREGTDGVTVLIARLQVHGRLPAPPVIRLILPGGAVLAEGVAEESLPLPPPGTTLERRYLVRELAGGWARITVDASSEAGGAHAEAIFPEEQGNPAETLTPLTAPLPPVTLPGGVTIDRAIPLDTKP